MSLEWGLIVILLAGVVRYYFHSKSLERRLAALATAKTNPKEQADAAL